MPISGISDSLQSIMSALDMEQLLARKKGEELIPDPGQEFLSGKDSLAAAIATERSTVVASNSSNPMDRNFVRKDKEESRYVAAALNAFKADRQIASAQQSSMTKILDEFGGINVSGTFNPGEAQSSAHYRRRIQQINEEQLMQESAARMKQERREQEEQLAEAAGITLPTDAPAANTAAPEAVLSASQVSAAAAPLPTVGSAPVVDGGSSAEAGAEAVSSTVEAAKISVDITV